MCACVCVCLQMPTKVSTSPLLLRECAGLMNGVREDGGAVILCIQMLIFTFSYSESLLCTFH